MSQHLFLYDILLDFVGKEEEPPEEVPSPKHQPSPGRLAWFQTPFFQHREGLFFQAAIWMFPKIGEPKNFQMDGL